MSSYFSAHQKRSILALSRHRAAYIPLVFCGAVVSLRTVWNISDIANGLMVIPNVICLLWLCRVVKSETAKYLWTGRINEPDPDCVKVNQEGKSLDPDQMDA